MDDDVKEYLRSCNMFMCGEKPRTMAETADLIPHYQAGVPVDLTTWFVATGRKSAPFEWPAELPTPAQRIETMQWQ